ncbi:MAG: HD domain-containing protein [Bacteroidales bacterium]|nr:HD domain-containing protein [Lachnoclostridium sp.]MCM1384997.1 HD domain-containing protein [Lachnoclostridium sp.]MCM1465885.1 HD domain-containing protein [Bacteroidales bacterium]
MDRIDKILKHDLFLYHLRKNQEAEADRCFCRHDMAHFLDVARIGEILRLEEEQELEREWIYAAALLHDLGKHIQYEDGTPHEMAGAEIAPVILKDCDFSEEESRRIVEAIRGHRDEKSAGERNLKGILYRADKASRACFACTEEKNCNWKAGKKNLKIKL